MFSLPVACKSLARWFTLILGLGEHLQKFFTTSSMKKLSSLVHNARTPGPWKKFFRLVECRSLAPCFIVPAVLRAPAENFKQVRTAPLFFPNLKIFSWHTLLECLMHWVRGSMHIAARFSSFGGNAFCKRKVLFEADFVYIFTG